MMNNSRSSSFDSIYGCEESNSEVNLNNAMMSINEELLISNEVISTCIGEESNSELNYLMSINGELSSNSNNGNFANVRDSMVIMRNHKKDADMPNDMNQTTYHSSLFEVHDSTCFMSLPPTHRSHHENKKSTSNLVENSINVHNSKEENCDTNKRVPLRDQLRRIFEEILEKHSISKSGTNNSNKRSSLLNSINLQNEKLDQLFTNSGDPVYRMTEANDRFVMEPMRSLQNMSHDESIFFLNKYLPKELVTILENSYENDSQLENSYWTRRCTGRLRKDT